MSEQQTIGRRLIPFTIDGQPFETSDLSQRAAALLGLAGLDPVIFDLGELVGKERPDTKRFDDDDIVEHSEGRPVRVDSRKRPVRVMRSGVQGFMDEMTEFGFAPTVEAELVIYGVTAIDGPHAGIVVATGVSIDEVVSWPQTPPALDSPSVRYHVPGDQQPRLAQVGMVDA